MLPKVHYVPTIEYNHNSKAAINIPMEHFKILNQFGLRKITVVLNEHSCLFGLAFFILFILKLNILECIEVAVLIVLTVNLPIKLHFYIIVAFLRAFRSVLKMIIYSNLLC